MVIKYSEGIGCPKKGNATKEREINQDNTPVWNTITKVEKL